MKSLTNLQNDYWMIISAKYELSESVKIRDEGGDLTNETQIFIPDTTTDWFPLPYFFDF
jgi:hypothetical protein